MSRQNSTNFSGALQFPYANAPTDLFKKEDVQILALATDQHNHDTGKGLILSPNAIPSGAINASKIGWPLLAPDGSSGAPSYSFASAPAVGLYRQSATAVGVNQDLVVDRSLSVSVNAGIGVSPTTGIPLSLAGIQSPAGYGLYWSDVGAGPMGIVLTTYGGIAANNVMQFSVANGTSSGAVTPLYLYGTKQVTVDGPLTVNQLITASANLQVSGTLGIKTAPDANALHVSGASYLQGTNGLNTPPVAGVPLALPNVGGGLVNSILWADAGAGTNAILINSVGGVATNCELDIYVANGTAGQNARVISMRGSGDVLLGGASPLAPAAGKNFPHIPYMGATPTTAPFDFGYAAMVWDSSTTRLWIWRGAWHYVQFT